MSHTPRWRYRFDNFKRALALLQEVIYCKRERELSDLELEGATQRFEYTWELAWNTIKDYLEDDGVVFVTITPKQVIVKGIEAKLITHRELWMKALEDRNTLSHVYSHEKFSTAIENIDQSYLMLFEELYEKLNNEIKDAQ